MQNPTTPSSIVAGGVFVMGPAVAGQREQFLPSTPAMIVSLVVIILVVVTLTDFDGSRSRS